MWPKEVSLVRLGINVTQDTAQRVSIPRSAHGREGHRLRLVLHDVEAALLKMIRHAGEISEMPRQHRAEGGAESPHLRQKIKKKRVLERRGNITGPLPICSDFHIILV